MHPGSVGWGAEVLLESAWRLISADDFRNPEAARNALRQIASWWEEACRSASGTECTRLFALACPNPRSSR